MCKSDGALLCSPFLPHLQPISCCYVLLPISVRQGTVPDLGVLIVLSTTLYPKSGGAQPQHCSPTVLVGPSELLPSCPAAAGSGRACAAGPGEQRLLSLPLPSAPDQSCALWAGREELLQGGSALAHTAGAQLEHSSVHFGVTSPQTLTFCHGSSHELCYQFPHQGMWRRMGRG